MIQRGRIADGRDQISLIRGIVRAFSYLTTEERRWTPVLVGSMILNALLSLFGVASIVPFFQLMVKPDPFATDSMLGKVLNALGVTSPLVAIFLAGGLFVGLMVLKAIYAILHMRLFSRFCSHAEARLATETLRRIVRAPFGWYLRQNTSILRDVVMNHIVEWSRGIIRPTLNLANNGLMVIAAIALLVAWTPLAALAIGAITLIVGYLLVRLARPKIALSSSRKRRHSLLAGVAVTEAITGGRDVRMSPAGEVLINEFRRDYSVYAYSDADARQWQIVPRQGIESIGVLGIVGMAVGAILSGVDRIEAASVLALYAVVAVRLIPVIGEFASAISAIQVSLPQFAQVHAVFEELNDFDTSRERDKRFDSWSEIRLSGVRYVYEGTDSRALDGVDLTFKRGLSYELVGSSGAGKSTLADIVAGLLPPTEGLLSIDGTTIDNATRAAWRGNAAYVAQNPIIFDATLADNIALGEPAGEDRDRRLAAAISAAGLDSVVAGLNHGSDTPIGDRGVRLSGGQRQRVAIARAMFQKSDLLILDEATSALNSETEYEITDSIEALKGKITLVVIAHRLSTVVRCDEIMVLERGRVTDRGSHRELLSESQPYRRLLEAQALEPVT